jgi:Spy/CpxP family protein refolding chaperone
MRIQPKVASALLALFLSSPLAFAQDPMQGLEPGQQAGPDDPAAHHRMWHGRMGEREQWEAGEHGWGRGCRMGMRGLGGERSFMLARLMGDPAIRERLGITPEQAAKVRQKSSDFRKAEIRSRADLGVKRIELGDLLSAEKPDRAAIDKKLQEISAAQLAREKTVIDYHLAMRNALTPEQREKLKKMRGEFLRRAPAREERRGPRGMERRDREGAAPSPNPQGEN